MSLRVLGKNVPVAILGDGVTQELILNLADSPFNIPILGKLPVEITTNIPDEIVVTIDPVLQQVHLRYVVVPELDEYRPTNLQLLF